VTGVDLLCAGCCAPGTRNHPRVAVRITASSAASF